MLREHNEFKTSAKETREKVKLLIQLADNLVEKGHAHANAIKQWVAAVDNTYKHFSSRMDKYRYTFLLKYFNINIIFYLFFFILYFQT